MVSKCLPLDLTLSSAPPPPHSPPHPARLFGFPGHPRPAALPASAQSASGDPKFTSAGRRGPPLGWRAPGGPLASLPTYPLDNSAGLWQSPPGWRPGRRAEGSSGGAFCLPFMVKIIAYQGSNFTKKRFSEIVSSCRSSASLITPRELNNCEHNGTQNHFVCK